MLMSDEQECSIFSLSLLFGIITQYFGVSFFFLYTIFHVLKSDQL